MNEKRKYTNNSWDEIDLELFSQDFVETILKMLYQAVDISLEINFQKEKKYQQKNQYKRNIIEKFREVKNAIRKI